MISVLVYCPQVARALENARLVCGSPGLGFSRRGPDDGPASETWRLGQNTFSSRSLLSSFAVSCWSVDMVAGFLLPRRVKRIEFLFHPWVGKIPWRRKWQPTLVFWPEKPHGQRSFGGLQSKWSEGVTDSTTKHTHNRHWR